VDHVAEHDVLDLVGLDPGALERRDAAAAPRSLGGTPARLLP
jgi:hypothetical protein